MRPGKYIHYMPVTYATGRINFNMFRINSSKYYLPVDSLLYIIRRWAEEEVIAHVPPIFKSLTQPDRYARQD